MNEHNVQNMKNLCLMSRGDWKTNPLELWMYACSVCCVIIRNTYFLSTLFCWRYFRDKYTPSSNTRLWAILPWFWIFPLKINRKRRPVRSCKMSPIMNNGNWSCVCVYWDTLIYHQTNSIFFFWEFYLLCDYIIKNLLPIAK